MEIELGSNGRFGLALHLLGSFTCTLGSFSVAFGMLKSVLASTVMRVSQLPHCFLQVQCAYYKCMVFSVV